MVKSICSECGAAYERVARTSKCDDCQPTERQRDRYTPKQDSYQAGYDYAWQKLSRKARKLSPFCQECGATDDLTTDHTPEAWNRKNAGKAIRLQDVAVLCRSCNSSAGAARGPRARKDSKPLVIRLTDKGDAAPPF